MLKVLVVDDDPTALLLMKEVFSSLGMRVHPTTDSRVAEEWIQREKFDGIMLDLMMPQLDGFELTAAIRRSSWNAKTPIVVISGHEDSKAVKKAFAAGASFFLPKPVDREKLRRLYRVIAGTFATEHRRFRRVAFTTEVTCEVGMRKLTGKSIDVSEGGMLFQAPRPVEVGQAVRISFRVPRQTKPIAVDGNVLRVGESHTIACYFTKINPKDLKALQEFIDRSH